MFETRKHLRTMGKIGRIAHFSWRRAGFGTGRLAGADDLTRTGSKTDRRPRAWRIKLEDAAPSEMSK